MEYGRVFECVSRGLYEQGLATYAALADPTPADARWAGVCALNLRQFERAKNFLLLAVGGGEAAANVELSTTLRQLGDLSLADQVLATVDEAGLAPFDRCLLYRERAALAYSGGALKEASELLEIALLSAYQSGPLQQVLLPAINQLFGLVLGSRGFYARAEQNFTLALEGSHAARSIYVRNSRGLCRLRLGKLDEADADLNDALRHSDAAPVARPVILYNLGLLAKARGDLAAAHALFAQAGDLAREVQELETECYAELALCLIAGVRGDQACARRHLARARVLSTGPKAAAEVLLAEGVHRLHAAEDTAVAHLEEAARSFADLGLRREEGIALLYLAEARAAFGAEDEALPLLDQVVDIKSALGNGLAFSSELRYLTRTLGVLQRAPVDAYARALYDDYVEMESTHPQRLDVFTLGRVEVRLDGQPVFFDLKRAVEILVYLLDRPGQRMNQVLLDLFPDTEPGLARNYFHQARYELQRRLPRLSVPHDPGSKSYRVQAAGYALSRDDREVDVAVARGGPALLRAVEGYQGDFLPDAESEWAFTRRSGLRNDLIAAGLKVLTRPDGDLGLGTLLDLAMGLHRVDPLEPGVGEALVRLTSAVEGRLSALHVLARLLQYHEQELGAPPPNLLALQETLTGQAHQHLDP
ncbi:transcriptional regulator, SARP family [Deinococcus aerius]|uniref:Transcriptional regulator, SARP family n=1 Tax=Deinococcus aerius TaxID=200253 RepID=A0A2I9DR08_9DEIO|nr:hypothetical protein [Deinococcus aerius]GBF04727.1 transcriptional regulator, SARP family [Deinococcus aerius]